MDQQSQHKTLWTRLCTHIGRLVDTGLAHAEDEDAIRRIRLANSFALLGFVLMFPLAGLDAWRGAFFEASFELVLMFFFTLPMALNHFGKPAASRTALVLLCNVAVLGDAYLIGSTGGAAFLCVCNVALSLSLFNGERPLRILLVLASIAVTMTGVLLMPEKGVLGDKGPDPAFVQKMNLAVCFVAVAALVWIQNLANRHYLARLHEAFDEREANVKALASISKLAALGQLSAGLAHEVNNPLAVIHARAEKMRDLLGQAQPDLDRLRHSSKVILETTKRISRVTHAMLSFARSPESVEARVLDTDSAVKEVSDICAELFASKSIAFEVAGLGGTNFVGGDGLLQQVLLNLVSNSRDAMLQAQTAEPRIRIDVALRSGKLVIDVSDNGPGIPSELADRIMEPFFTTKALGKGTGIGLSLSRGLVEAMGGKLSLEQLEAPTTFRIELPAHAPSRGRKNRRAGTPSSGEGNAA